MRSARTLFASAAVTAVLAVSVPAAYAVTSADDWDKDSGSSASSNDDREKPDSWKHDKPEGGVHAGGGALAGVSADDWEKDKESGSGSSDGEKTWKHEKPEGGVHTGGGAMALSGSGLAAGSVLMLGGIGAVAYKLRRRNASGAAAA
ncbi:MULTISPECIES: hypothetical protein [unclassified Streptomyces]|uniref:hypothetical protein n=1 Tax=unclassified Streptomyces TaxID=2593676 RepID=UPI0036BC835E